MYRFRVVILFFILIGSFGSLDLLGQNTNCKPSEFSSDFAQGTTCAPVNVSWNMEVRRFEAGTVEFVYDWGDGTPNDIVSATKSYIPDPLNPGNIYPVYTADNIAYHTYAQGGTECTYVPRVFLRIDGVLCTIHVTTGGNVTVHDLDQYNGGNLAIDPMVYRVCAGNSATVTFRDVSQWNCTPPSENQNINSDNRWVQWIYGTLGDPRTRIANAVVGTSPVTVVNSPSMVQGDVTYYPAPVTASGDISLPVTVPATATVGQVFEVTLRNWNKCNPYDNNLGNGPLNPGNLVDGDNAPITQTALIVVVDAPDPQFTIRRNGYGGAESFQFCPGERVFFNNTTANGYDYEWSFEVPIGADAIDNITGKNINTNLFTHPGIYKATLTVTDNNAAGSCIATLTKDIEIIQAPSPAMEISVDDGSGMAVTTNYDFCEMVGDNYNFSIANQTTVPTGANPEYTWSLKRVSGPTIKSLQTTAIADLFTFSLSQPGAYEVSLIAKDLTTDCGSPVTQRINIYNAPEASLEIVSNTELCVGKETVFNDLSGFVNTKAFADDEIVAWNWWFDYANNPGAAPVTDENPMHIFPLAGNYQVRLMVETKYGCVDDTLVNIVVNPVALAEITVDHPEDCAPHEPTFTNVRANLQPTGVDVLKYKWYIYSGGTFIDTVTQEPDGSGAFVDTMAYEFLYTQGDNLDQVYEVYMEAYAVGGCVSTSNIIPITVFPSAAAKFTSNYNPLASNCTPVNVDFNVDLATKNLPFSKEYSWSVFDGNGDLIFGPTTPDAGAETFSHPFTNSDSISVATYEVRLDVTSSNGPCLQPFMQQIRVNPTPSSKFTVVESKDCEVVSITFDANQKGLSPSNYYWTFIETTTNAPKAYVNNPALDDNFALQFERGDADSVVEVTLRTRNFAGCESTGPSLYYTIPKLDDFIVAFDTAAVTPKCAPQEIAFENNSVVPSGTTFELKVQKGSSPAYVVPMAEIIGDITDEFSYTLPEAGEYVVTLKGTYSDGCVAEQSKSITVHPNVEAIFAPSGTVVCPNQPVYLNEASTPKSIITQKQWTIIDQSDNSIVAALTGSQLFYIFENPGEYEIQLEVVSNNGCRDVTSHLITVQDVPEFTLEFNDPNCDQTFHFEVEAIDPAITIDKYQWVWGDGTSEETTVPENLHIYANRNSYFGPDHYSGTVTATASTGCTFTATFDVELLQDVDANFLMDKDAGCAPLTISFNSTLLGASDFTWEYREFSPTAGTWKDFSNKETDPIQTFTNTGSEDKIFEVRIRAWTVDVDGNPVCYDEKSKYITVNPEIKADFTYAVGQQCSPYEVEFTNTSLGFPNPNVEYVWNWGDGSPEEITSAEKVTHVFENSSFTVQRNFKVSLRASHQGSSCTNTKTETIVVFPTLRAEIEPSDTVGCAPFAVKFKNDHRGVTSGHRWQVFNMNINQEMTDFEAPTADFSPVPFENKTFDSIRYMVLYTGTSTEGCVVRDTAYVKVYPEISPSFTATPIEQNLPNSTVTINNTTFDNPDYKYLWDFGNGHTSTERNPAPYNYGTYGVFTITLTVTDEFKKCPKTFSQMVTINPTIPEIDFEYNPAEGCGPLTVQFFNKSKFVDLKTLVWDFGDNSSSFSSDENPTYTYYEPGEYTVTLKGSNEIGITVEETKKYIINVYDNPRANFRVYQRMPVYIPDSVVFFNESRGAVSYLWDFGDGNTSTKFEPKHAYTKPGNYEITLIAISEQGCADTLRRMGEIVIEGKFEVKVPNVFTPNGDLDNEVFLPLMQGVVEYKMMIYNRWGELLFESNSPEVGWDGYYKGVLSPTDVYIYKLDLKFTNGERTSKFGDVTLLR